MRFVRTLMMQEIMRSSDAQCNTKESSKYGHPANADSFYSPFDVRIYEV